MAHKLGRRFWLWHTGLWLALLIGLAGKQGWTAGYMDEAYYLAVGREWAHGRGLREPFLWHFLNDPTTLPQPAGSYWAPGAALVAGLGVLLARVPDALLAPLPGWDPRGVLLRAGFVLLAASMPWLSAQLARALGGDEVHARWAALWATASGFYLAFLPAADGFAGLMVLAAGFWWLTARLATQPRLRYMGVLGALAGAIHLFRSEGWLWLGWALFVGWRAARARGALTVGVGYLSLMAPWWWRQTQVWGTPFPPGQTRVLWLTDYNDLFLYPASQLTFARWWSRGLGSIGRERLWALGQNLQTALAVQGGLLLALPWIGVGGWRLRRHPVVRAAAGMWLALFVLMTGVFPYPGVRGGFFHAGAGVQPMLWALAGLGFPEGLRALARRRGWDPAHAQRYLGTGWWGLLLLLTLGITATRLGSWGDSTCMYQQAYTQRPDLASAARVMLNNPPLWTWVTGGQAVVTPTGRVHAVLEVATRYRVPWLLLEAQHPPTLAAWYTQPRDRMGYRYLGPITWTGRCAAHPPAQLYVLPDAGSANAPRLLRSVPQER
ncbi:MAG: hypothetical protein GXO36_03200 [Chloroflexi bacterium]|nr:hypothetical protein [Chloroflexota bacterium]